MTASNVKSNCFTYICNYIFYFTYKFFIYIFFILFLLRMFTFLFLMFIKVQFIGLIANTKKSYNILNINKYEAVDCVCLNTVPKLPSHVLGVLSIDSFLECMFLSCVYQCHIFYFYLVFVVRYFVNYNNKSGCYRQQMGLI